MKYICEYCGKEFRTKPSTRKGKHVFCSRECSNKYHFKGKEKATMKYICEYCGKEFKRSPHNVRGKHVFCCSSCRSKFYGYTPQRKPDFTLQKKLNTWAKLYAEHKKI